MENVNHVSPIPDITTDGYLCSKIAEREHVNQMWLQWYRLPAHS